MLEVFHTCTYMYMCIQRKLSCLEQDLEPAYQAGTLFVHIVHCILYILYRYKCTCTCIGVFDACIVW